MWTCAGVVLALAACVQAITRDQFYPYGAGLDLVLPKGEEVASPELPLKVPVRFYGETYDTIFVNNFGVVSFRADIPSFLNAEFPLPYPSVAAFYANIDTTNSGTVYYRESDDPRVLIKAETSVQNNFHDYFDFKPTSVFIATWLDVTYNSLQGTDRKNTFQLALISNGTESFAEFLYPEREIQWIQKETQQGALPDAKAQAGFSAEDGRLFSLRGSGSHQIRNIVSWSNVNEPGKYVFRIGEIPPDGNIVVPDQYDQNEIEEEDEYKTCAHNGPSICHIQARCVDYQEGICCQCNEGYYGNGKSCVKDDVPLRVHGRLSGKLNNIPLNEVDLQAYVVVSDGRSYTALTQAPVKLGGALQFVNVLGGVIGWLFAKPLGNARNGYQLTGSLFNHTAEIVFPATGDRVTITQEYLGHNVFDQITLNSDIQGSVPFVNENEKLEISEYEEKLTFVEPGLMQSESIRTLTNKATGEKYEQRISQAFHYKTCRYAPINDEDVLALTLKVGKLYLGYEIKENIVRYGMSNKLIPLGLEDPCLQGKYTCGPHSTCVVQGSSFTCICQTGYTDIYQGNVKTCIDIDECTAGTHNCDSNAECYNHKGGFRCRCQPGYEGDGIRCQAISKCENLCDSNADCIDNNLGEEAICVCKPGYTGDGRQCWQTAESSCDIVNNCSPNADCAFSYTTHAFVCQCKYGYIGDGYYCEEQNVTQSSENNEPNYNVPNINEPNYNAPNYNEPTYNVPNNNEPTYSEPNYNVPNNNDHNYNVPNYNEPTYSEPNYNVPNNNDHNYNVPNYNEPNYNEPNNNETYVQQNCNEYECTCPDGYSEDSSVPNLCKINTQIPVHNASAVTCSTEMDCPPNAVCSYSIISENFECVCQEGYENNGYGCVEKNTNSCQCGPKAYCTTTSQGKDICVCEPGYHGDGYTCRPNFSCTNSSDCEYHAECKPDPLTGEDICQCIDGYTKDFNDACILAVSLCNNNICVEHASCLYDENEYVDYCQCDPGYEGEGILKCVPQGRTCDCHPDATCVKNIYSYECVCKEGYVGDGYSCALEPNCKNDAYLCDTHASCLKRSEGYVCECNTGYFGNGSYCQQNPRMAGNFLFASDGVFIYRVPLPVSSREIATPINSAIDQIAVGIDVDCQTGRVYWGDVVSNTIKRSAYDGTRFEIFLSWDVRAPEGISIDWVSRNIFWTDSRKRTIEVANLETKLRKVLFSYDIHNPRGIAVHPQRGKLFWSDWDRINPKIEWSNMDGSDRQVFLRAPDVKLPNSLAMDWKNERLCYADAGLRSIECVNIDTKQKDTITTNCSYPFGITVHDDTFYWTDWKTLKIEYIEGHTSPKKQVPISTASRKLYGVAAAPEQCNGLSNVCQYRNGNCGYNELCLPDSRGGRTCVVSDQTAL